MAKMLVELSGQTIDKIEEIRGIRGFTSKVDVVRKALVFFYYCVKELEKGNELTISTKEGEIIKSLVMDW